ncbi:MAG: peptidoglycan synthetase [Flavobacteriales bacterium]|nr:peptidoglycan synthetase [Flavobacteriales bacterium]
MKIHLIAIGGSAMHNLAIALHKSGHQVSGSDDEIFEPSKGRLLAHGLLPKEEGWRPDLISQDLDAVILGMHARIDNPELLRAKELGLRIYSYPEYLFECAKNKQRIVVGGSHGKTTVTGMILHVLQQLKIETDYMVGAQLRGFNVMVRITDAPRMVLEGDEYLSSPIDRRPKFHLYRPHIAILTGIAWDHINVFPTFENYLEQFSEFINTISTGGTLIYFEDDTHLEKITADCRSDIHLIPYSTPNYTVERGITTVHAAGRSFTLKLFGKHNLQNLEGARLICSQLGVCEEDFWEAASSFTGADKRLERLDTHKDVFVYKDFAHSPSKLKATIQAVRDQHPQRKLVACLELHTFSSLNKSFLGEYAHCMDLAHNAVVYYNPTTIAHKRLEEIEPPEVKSAFAKDDIEISNDARAMVANLQSMQWGDKVLLWMSSGNFDGCSIEDIAKSLRP